MNQVTLLANAGIMLRMNGKTIMIDALHDRETPPFSSTPQEVLRRVMRKEPPFERIDISITTHRHPDHYSQALTQQMYATHQETQFVLPKGTLVPGARVSILRSGEDRLSFGGVNLYAYQMTHEGAEYAHVKNYGFVIEYEGSKVIVLGDAGFTEISDFLADQNPDALFVNFPFFTLVRGRQALAQVQTKKLFAYHLPFAQQDVTKYQDALRKTIEREKINATVLCDILQTENF